MTVVDFHTHLGTSIFGYGQTLSALLERMDQLGIDRSVVIAVQPFEYHLEPENDAIAMAVQQAPQRLIGFARVDPRQGERAEMELERCVRHLGFKGLFLHPWEESCPVNSDVVKTLMQTVRRLRIPVMIAGGHVRVSMASQIADLAAAFPDIVFIATSGGQINISGVALAEATQLLREHSNVWLETSGIYREDFIEDLVPLIGVERMLFGSNSPEYDQSFEILRPRLAHLSPAQKQALLGGNACRLLNIC
jgi:predicted TIM-barrel fold metal-dependent hydrolase